MNKIKDADFMTKFPPALKKDESMLALGQLIADELHITAHEIKKNIIYTNIEELSETLLDVLAYDLHVDWYDYDYPIEIKRNIVKSSLKVHKKMGTKYAVENALKALYPESGVEEWFEYGGRPYTFRIKIKVGSWGIPENTAVKMIRDICFYKNLRSHCEYIYFILNAPKARIRAAPYLAVSGLMKIKAQPETNLQSSVKEVAGAGITAAEIIKVKPEKRGEKN